MKKNNIEYKIGGQIWVQKNGENFLGPGRVALLEHLSNGLNLNETALLLNMEHDTAYKNIKSINKISEEPLIKELDNGTYEVTKYGIDIINVYKKLKEEHKIFLEKLNKQFDDELLT